MQRWTRGFSVGLGLMMLASVATLGQDEGPPVMEWLVGATPITNESGQANDLHIVVSVDEDVIRRPRVTGKDVFTLSDIVNIGTQQKTVEIKFWAPQNPGPNGSQWVEFGQSVNVAAILESKGTPSIVTAWWTHNGQNIGDIPITGVGLVPLGPKECAGDQDYDDDTDVLDFGAFAASFGENGLDLFEQGDLDGDGDCDVIDFGIFAGDFGCVGVTGPGGPGG